MKRTLAILVAAIAGVALAAAIASAAPKSATVVIRHQTRGCHSWSVNGGPFKPAQTLSLARGGAVTFVDNDVMPHQLIKTSGPAVKFYGKAKMSKMGATTKVVFSKAGTYRFTTKAGEDYMKGVKTIGEDNVLKLTVKVA